MKLNVMMASRSQSHVIRLNLRKSSNAEEVHDIVVEELIRAGKENTATDRLKVHQNGDSSVIRNIPLNSASIKSVAVSPPFIGIVLSNGKVCRYKICEESDDSVDTCATGPEISLDAPQQNDDGNGTLADVNFPDSCLVAPKRQRIDGQEEVDKMFSVNNLPTIPQLEESYEERRFNMLIQSGLARGRNEECDSSSEPNQSDMRADPFYPPDLDENGSSVIEAMDISELDDGLIQRSDIPSVVPDILEIQDPGPSQIMIEDACDTGLPVDQSMLSAVIPPTIIGNSCIFSPRSVSPSDARTPLASATSCSSSNETSLNRGQRRKRGFEYPVGFQPMTDKLSFMHKSTSNSKADETKKDEIGLESKLDSEKTSKSNSNSVSIEWLQSDCKHVQFDSITATHSDFLLVTRHSRKLWTWPVPRKNRDRKDLNARPFSNAAFLGLEGEKIQLIHSDMIRVTVSTKSGKISSFFDAFISGQYPDNVPNLIKRLTVPATSFPELQSEDIIDIKSGTFFSVALTRSGKVFWWGMAPDHLKKSQKWKKQSHKHANDATLKIGDVVALKERKEELGSIVIKNHFANGPVIGVVLKIHETDKSNDAHERRHYSVELIGNGFDFNYCESFHRRSIALSDSKQKEARTVDWSSDEVIFLEERACTVGAIVGLDGHFAIVSPHTYSGQHESKKLKVCLKTSLTKVSDSTQVQNEGAHEFLINEDRYSHTIRDSPICVVDPNGGKQQYGGFKAVAISTTKHGLAMLLNRLSDQKAFLVHPEGAKEDNSKVFTCNATTQRSEKDFLVSDSNITSEFESVCARRCMLDIPSVEKERSQGGKMRQKAKLQVDDVIKAPQLSSISTHGSLILLDSNGCLFPIRFGSCLLQSGIPEALPLRMLRIVEANYGDESNEEISVTMIAVQESLVLAPTIIDNDKKGFDEALQNIENELKLSGETSDVTVSSLSCKGRRAHDWLSEKSSGNQNIMHLCAGHLSIFPNNIGTSSNIESNSSSTQEDDVYMLRKLLNCSLIEKDIIRMLQEKDSLSCTPFLTAVWTKNFHAALLILKAILEFEKSNPSLFKEAVCCKSVTGMTSLHHMVFHASGLQPNLILQNSLVVSNIPSNYSPRMLLQLFKERYASAYRACIPVPSEKWQIKTASENTKLDESLQPEATSSRLPANATFIPTYAPTRTPTSQRLRYGVLNRADALRATAKQGVVMFNDIAEMNEALAEMDQHALICKDERGPGGLTSVARYIIQVHRADDKDPNNFSNQTRNDDVTRSRPTRHIIHPALQASPLRLPRGHLFSDPFLSRSVTYGRHLLPHALHGSRVSLPREVLYNEPASTQLTSDVKVCGGAQQRNPAKTVTLETKFFMEIFRDLFEAHPEVAFLVNDQEETPLAYYLNNAKRLTPSAVYGIFGRWMTCNSYQCKTNVLIKKLKERMGLLAASKSGSSLERTVEKIRSVDENVSEVDIGVKLDYLIDKSFEGRNSKDVLIQGTMSATATGSVYGSISASRSSHTCGGTALKMGDDVNMNLTEEGHGESKLNENSDCISMDATSNASVTGNWGPLVTPSQQQNPIFADIRPMVTLLDSAPPQGLPNVTLQPTQGGLVLSQEEKTIADVERLASLCNDSIKGQTMEGNPSKDPNKNPNKISKTRPFGNKGSDFPPSSGATNESRPDSCACLVDLCKVNMDNLKRLLYTLRPILFSKRSLLGTILGNPCEGDSQLFFISEGGSQQQASTRVEGSSICSKMSIEKLDSIVSNLMLNPVPFATHFVVISLLQMSHSKVSDVVRTFLDCSPNPEISLLNVIGCRDFEPGIIETAVTYRRFLGSVVRQLSFCLSKESNVDPKYCHKIGRYSKMKMIDEDERTMESIRSTLRSFSWLSVIEILKAAETTIRPVRLGIAKAQPRGIMSGLQGMGERPSTSMNAHMMHSILGTSARVARSSRRSPDSFRSSAHVKVASRKSSDIKTGIFATKLIRSDSNEEDANQPTRGTFAVPSGSRDSGHMSSNLHNNNGSMSPLAWTLDGHVRVSDMPRGRSFPIPDFLEKRPDPDTVPSIHAGNCYLAQMFSRLVKEAVDLANDLAEGGSVKYCTKKDIPNMDMPETVEKELMDNARRILSKSWEWLNEVMGSIETQLKAGEGFDTQRFATRSLRLDQATSDVSSLGRPPSFSQSYVSKPEEYLMYLLKVGSDDNSNDVFPILDLMSYSHVTFVLDAYFYMLKKWPYGQLGHFERTKSKDGLQASVFGESDRFFGQNMTNFDVELFKENQCKVLKNARSPHLWLSPQFQDEVADSKEAENQQEIREQFKSSWKSTISAFAKLFLAESPGMERDCFLAEHAGSAGRIARFQRALAQIKEDCLPKNITEESRPFTASIRRHRFLMDGFKCLLPVSDVDNHPYSSLNIRFEGEEGTGPGVNRGFFTGFANTLTGDGGTRHACFLTQPGQLPEQARVFATRRIVTWQRNEDVYKHVFVAIGRFLGLVLWFNQAVPITFTRPILKFLLSRENDIKFEDLAYHNSTLYSSFCQMIIDGNSPTISEEEFQDIYCSNFEFTIDEVVHELIPGGSKVKVTKDNILELVRLSSSLIMIGAARSDLESMRIGLHQIIPKKLLQPLSAEDFQLLLSGGIGDVDFTRLKSIIRFNNSRNCSRESLEKFKGWFWTIVHDMTSQQRMKLLYFLTGSSVLPAFDNKIGNNEELAITVDIVGQSSSSLPVASTCGQRLSMPLYESKKELRRKLLIAIECETYGLG